MQPNYPTAPKLTDEQYLERHTPSPPEEPPTPPTPKNDNANNEDSAENSLSDLSINENNFYNYANCKKRRDTLNDYLTMADESAKLDYVVGRKMPTIAKGNTTDSDVLKIMLHGNMALLKTVTSDESNHPYIWGRFADSMRMEHRFMKLYDVAPKYVPSMVSSIIKAQLILYSVVQN